MPRFWDRSRCLSLYLEELGRCSILTPQQESDLVARMGDDADDPFRYELATKHLRFVVHVARGYRNWGLPLEDLIAEGNLGLLQAARRFDPRRRLRFKTCAVWWIRKSILEALDRNGCLIRIPSYRLRAIREARATADHQPRESVRDDKRPESSRGLRLSRPEMEELLELRKAPVRLDQDDVQSVELRIRSNSPQGPRQDPAELLERNETNARLRRALVRLSPRKRLVLELHYGLNHDEPLSLKETGRKLGVSHERVRQIEVQARRELQRFLVRRSLPDYSRSGNQMGA